VTVQPRCPFCLDLLLPDEERVRCARCRTPHHAECFQLNEGCVAFGCEGADEVSSGMSVFQRQELKLGTPPASRASLGPFTLYHRAVGAPPERQTEAASARLLLETREVREGGRLGGRAGKRFPCSADGGHGGAPCAASVRSRYVQHQS